MDAERLHQLAKTLLQERPDYIVRTSRIMLKVWVTPEELVVIDALAAEAGASRDGTVLMLLRSLIRADPVLIRKTFTGTEKW